MKYFIGLFLISSCFACDKCKEIEQEILNKIFSIVQEYNANYKDLALCEQTRQLGRIQSYLEIHCRFFKTDFESFDYYD